MPNMLYQWCRHFMQRTQSVLAAAYLLAAAIAMDALLTPVAAAGKAADIEMWRLDCGEMIIEDISYFSDTNAYEGQSATIANGCYLVRNGDRYLLWDMGLPQEVLGNTTAEGGWTSSIKTTIADQLNKIDLSPKDIDFVGVSHFHGDHIGQASDFPQATLLMSRADVAWIKNNPPGNARRRLSPWFDGDASVADFARDHDVFSDGAVTILALPGHTPGHSGLLVRLPKKGPVLLSGDLYHLGREVGRRTVSRWNASRADTLASIERFEGLQKTMKPTVIVQHEPGDVGKLPTFPKSAK